MLCEPGKKTKQSAAASKNLSVNSEIILQRKKLPIIRPLLVQGKYVTDTQMKANIFNKFFAEQCTPLKNNNVLPVNQMFLTQSRLSSICFNEDEILKIVRALNINKAHGHDDISIRMIKICNKSLLKPLIISFENSTKSSCYPDI